MMPVLAKERRDAFVMGTGQGRKIRVGLDEVTIKISSRDTGGEFAIFEGKVGPQQGPPLHLHQEQDEGWFVLEGEYRFEVDGEEIYAGPGDTIFAPRGKKHTFQNIGRTTGRLLTTVVPGGLDLFFEEVEEAASRGTDLASKEMIPLFEKYGLELHGPPMSARPKTSATR